MTDTVLAHPQAIATDTAVVAHVADNYKRYPGEVVRFSTRVSSGTGIATGRLAVQIPCGLELVDFGPLEAAHAASLMVRDLGASGEGIAVSWQLTGLESGETLEFYTCVRVLPLETSAYLVSSAVLRDAEGFLLAEENARVAARARSAYMQYLPEIYHDDSLANRLLMLVESFWKPLDMQIGQPDVYYDAHLAPPAFLDWISGWIGMQIDESLPVERRRALLTAALSLYQRTGTRQALAEYLCLYTGGEVEITEHRAQNMQLGPSAQLGLAVALGTRNFPHTFTVRLSVSQAEILRGFGRTPASEAEETAALALYQKRIETVIAAQKPAHTAFYLVIQAAAE
jgi:phage tail-like protein